MKTNKNRNSQISELESYILAEEELSSIFSKSKLTPKYNINSTCGQAGQGMQHSMYSNSTHSTNTGNSNNNIADVGFSNYGHFRAPIKRPSCNPIVKDERFKRLNTVNND